MPILPQPITVFTPVLNNYQFKAGLQQPLFTGFRLSSMEDAAELNKRAAEEEFSKEKNDVAFQIIKAFWQYHKAEKVLMLLKENYESLRNHRDDAQAFYNEKLITKNELLKISVELSSVELKVIEADNALKMAQAYFNKTIGLPVTAATAIEIPMPALLPPPADFEVLMETAVEKRGEIGALENRLLMSKEQQDIAAADWYPDIMLFSNFYYAQPNQRIFPPEEKFDDSWDVGVMLQWDVWDWGRRSAANDEAAVKFEQLKEGLANLQSNIQLEVYKHFLAAHSAFDKVMVTELNVQQAEEQYRLTADKFAVQFATATELTDSETALLKAKTEYETAVIDYQIARAELNKSAGIIIY
jgi:outer membrane protein TolC